MLRHRDKPLVANIFVDVRLEVSAHHLCVDGRFLDERQHLCFGARKVRINCDFELKERALRVANASIELVGRDVGAERMFAIKRIQCVLPLHFRIIVPEGPVDVVRAVDGCVLCLHSILLLHVVYVEDGAVVVHDRWVSLASCRGEEEGR